jgi:hypothetical protein
MPETNSSSLSVALNVVVAALGLVMVKLSPDTNAQEYEYGVVPPEAVTVVDTVVSVASDPVLLSVVGEALAVIATRVISTDTTAVFVAATASVTVQVKTALYVEPLARLEPVNVVVAAEAESAEIDVEPLVRTHE